MYTNYVLIKTQTTCDKTKPQLCVGKYSSQSYIRMRERLRENADAMLKSGEGWEITEEKERAGKIMDFPIGECSYLMRLANGNVEVTFRIYRTAIK